MVKSNEITSSGLRMKTYLVFGRANPTEAVPEPKIVAVRVFAPNAAVARSRFWKLNKKDHKLKKANGQLLKVQEVHDNSAPKARNYGIFLKYRSHTGVTNLFKEFRDVSQAGALEQMLNEVGGNYRASNERVEVMKVTTLKDNELSIRNPRCRQWSDAANTQYALWNRKQRPTDSKYNKIFAAKKPVTFKTGISINK